VVYIGQQNILYMPTMKLFVTKERKHTVYTRVQCFLPFLKKTEDATEIDAKFKSATHLLNFFSFFEIFLVH
jgi:hypothetical protein